MIARIMFFVLAACGAAHGADDCAPTNKYSIPFGQPVMAYCCTVNTDPVALEEFNKPPVTNDYRKTAPRTGPNRVVKSVVSECVRLDSMTPFDRLQALAGIRPLHGSCVLATGSYDHYTCTCTRSCEAPLTWSCNNCPGLAPGELPADPVDLTVPPSPGTTQDSHRSRIELISVTQRLCSSGPPPPVESHTNTPVTSTCLNN